MAAGKPGLPWRRDRGGVPFMEEKSCGTCSHKWEYSRGMCDECKWYPPHQVLEDYWEPEEKQDENGERND